MEEEKILRFKKEITDSLSRYNGEIVNSFNIYYSFIYKKWKENLFCENKKCPLAVFAIDKQPNFYEDNEHHAAIVISISKYFNISPELIQDFIFAFDDSKYFFENSNKFMVEFGKELRKKYILKDN